MVQGLSPDGLQKLATGIEEDCTQWSVKKLAINCALYPAHHTTAVCIVIYSYNGEQCQRLWLSP